ncbi:alpha-glucosidase [Phycisphaerales bacterium]|nr:alpha-glucosidase [Phycisphaerales bacterium]
MHRILIAVVFALMAVSHSTMASAQSDGVIGESLGDRTVRFFASPAAKEAAHPSYSLAEEPAAKGVLPAAPADFAVRPVFGQADGKQVAKVVIAPGTSLYGTGEAAGPLLRNGRRVTAWNTDAYGYDDTAPSLYQSHPWVLAVRADGTAFGVLADTTYRCVIDTAYSDPLAIQFIADGPAFPVIVIDAAGPREVLKELARLTGYMPLPPRWALGYHQCRYSYFPEARAREIAKGFRENDIPCDVIWYDIDYMEAFRVFTFDRGYFPDPKKLNADLSAMGFHNVWMIDPGVKADEVPGPSDRPADDLAKEPAAAKEARKRELAAFAAMRDSGTANDVWVKQSDDKVYKGDVWPGPCMFPDYTAPHARAWWASLYEGFLDNGITGVWNDMNEPAIFNVASKTMPESNQHAGDPAMVKPNGKAQGIDEAAADGHARYHNVYGMQMIRGTREGIAAARPGARPFVLSRANYIGGQRFGATWTGDNTANWYHLESSIPMSLNVGLSGQPFIGPDIGGFANNGDAKLFARWMGVGSLLPFARGHTGKGNIDKEPWAFGPEVAATCREALNRRYRLLPYLYTLFREASVTGLPVARPTFFADPKDPALRSEDDSFLLGDDLLVVGQLVPDRTRAPIMPLGEWNEIERSTDADLPRLFVRAGAIVPTGPAMEWTGEMPLDPVTLHVCLDHAGRASGTLYEDSGDGYGYQNGQYLLTTYRAESNGGVVTVTVGGTEGSMKRPARKLVVRVVTHDRAVEGHGEDGAAVDVNMK